MGASVFLCVFIIIKRFFHSIVFLLSFYQKSPQKRSPSKRQHPPPSIINFLLYKSLYSYSHGAKKIRNRFGLQVFFNHICVIKQKRKLLSQFPFSVMHYIFFMGSPLSEAMLQLNSPITTVRPASLFSMRTNKNQLNTMGNPKSFMKLNSSVTSIAQLPLPSHYRVQGNGMQASFHGFHNIAAGSVEDVVVYHHRHGRVKFRLGNAGFE